VSAQDGKKLLIGPDEGAYLPTLRITHKVTAESFGGAFTSIEARLPPGEMIPPHTHTREDECNFVLEGELTFDIGGQIVVAPVGSFVIKPRGIYHAFCNAGTEVARFLEFHTPGGFEDYYDEYEQIVRGEMDEEEERLRARSELGERYGVAMARRAYPGGHGPLGHRSLVAPQPLPLLAPIHRSAWKGNSPKFALLVRTLPPLRFSLPCPRVGFYYRH
jgi:quercetin dioxygenase-like cupin family protein